MKVVRYLLILAAIVLALVIATELLWRTMNPQPMEPGFSLKTSNELRGMTSENVVFRVDSHGLRGLNWSEGKDGIGIRLLAVGGQATNHPLQNPEQLWWGVLAESLKAKSGKEVEAAAVNLGPEPTIANAYGVIAKTLKEVNVDVIVVMLGLGDIIFQPEDYKLDENIFEKEANDNPSFGLGHTLAKYSHVLRSIRNSRVRAAKNREFGKYRRKNYFASFLPSAIAQYRQLPSRLSFNRDQDPMEEYVLGLDKLKKLADQKGVKLIIAGEPTLHSIIYESKSGAERVLTGDRTMSPAGVLHLGAVERVENGRRILVRLNPGWIEQELNRYYFAARDKCAELGIPFVDLNGTIPRDLEHFLTEVILTDKGAAKAAEMILPAAEKAVSG
ncbi:MAG: hypothetical protein AAGA58_06765 [Verrucomicrobiota bacterium]